LTQEACDTYYPHLNENGILVVDAHLVTQLPTKNYYGFPFVQLAREKIGNVIMANVVALGAITELTGIVSKESIKRAVLERAPRGTEEKNKKALELGFAIAKKAKKG
jgi:2-oxoglutarate ferredoxin oxidoreductase subunit gamma